MVAIQTFPDAAPPSLRPRLVLMQGGRAEPGARIAPEVYRRRRLAAAVLAFVLVVGAWAGVLAGERMLVGGPGDGSLTVPAAATPAPPGAHVHVVRPGETVWSIARQLHPDGDVRATVDHLVARNGGVALRAGQRLVVD